MANYSLPRATPESQGISSGAILGFVDKVEKDIHDLHSFMLLRGGQVVAEGWWGPYAPERKHMLFSLSKSFTAAAVGMAVEEGRLTLNDPVVSFFPEDAPAEISANLAAMRVRQLLSMSSGHDLDTMGRLFETGHDNMVRAFLALAVEHKPGTHFVYNTGASYMLSAIMQQVTGQTLLEYLGPRLFEPLGIEGATWESCPRGINMGGFGLSIRTEDIACFGQLYLQKGMWNGKRILSEAWVAEASARQISNGSNPDSDWEQGYGYQFWRCRHNAYRGDGAFGQYCVVMPEQDVVLAITGGLGDMQAPLNAVWDCLLADMSATQLPANLSALMALKSRLENLALLPPGGEKTSALEAGLNGKRYRLEDNEHRLSAISFSFDAQRIGCVVEGAEGAMSAACGRGEWLEGSTRLFSRGEQPVAASGVWTAKDTLTLTLRFFETPFYQTIACTFDGDTVSLLARANVSFDAQEPKPLTGKLE